MLATSRVQRIAVAIIYAIGLPIAAATPSVADAQKVTANESVERKTESGVHVRSSAARSTDGYVLIAKGGGGGGGGGGAGGSGGGGGGSPPDAFDEFCDQNPEACS